MLEATRRPSLAFIVALWAGLLLGRHAALSLPAVAVILAGLVACLLAAPHRLRLLFLALGFFMLGVLRSPESEWNAARIPDLASYQREFPVIARVEIPFLVGECSEQVKARVCQVRAGYPEIEGTRVFLRGLEDAGGPRGREFTVLGRFRTPRRGLNPYSTDRRAHYLRQGVIGEIDVENVIGEPCSHVRSLVLGLRMRLGSLIRDCSAGDSRGMLEALLLGKRGNLSAGLRTLMVKTGAYHVLAISGLHVGIVVLVLTTFLSALRLGRTGRIVGAVVCVLAYVVFTGARPSAQRAWTFFLLVAMSRLLQWKTDYPNCVCAAGTVLLLVSPHLAWDVGFKLSLGAVFGITLLVPQLGAGMGPPASVRGRIKNYVALGLAASFSAQVFTLPIVLYYFGRVSLIGPVANLVLLPLVTLIVAAGLEATVVLPVCASLAGVFMCGASSLTALLVACSSVLTRFVNPLVYAGRPGTVRIVVYSGVIACLCLWKLRIGRPVRTAALVLMCVFLAAPFPGGGDHRLRLVFLYVGDGDACVAEMPDGRVMLIDAGASGESFDAGLTYLMPFLAVEGRRRIDTAVITHPHNDHYGGLTSLIDAVEVGEVLVATRHGEEQYEGLLRRMEERGIGVRTVVRGEMLTYGDALVEVLHPSQHDIVPPVEDPNALSVVLRLSYGNLDVLLTGDLTPAVQKRLVEAGDNLRCDILKVPHHGAPCAVDSTFLEALDARLAVISVGSRFSSHPCPQTIRQLERSGARTLSTVTDGAVTVTSDGKTTTVECHASQITETFR
jgi:competence protein ComEC